MLYIIVFKEVSTRMTLIAETVQKEKSRIEFMLCEYEKRLLALPKGTLSEKHSGEKTYYYLKFRDGKKVVSQYIPAEDAEQLRNDIAERRHIETMIKSLKEELKFANRALGVKE